MTTLRKALFTLLIVALSCTPQLAQATATDDADHTVSTADLEAAVQTRVNDRDASRARIVDFLHRDEVRRVAEAAGLDVHRAEAAVATLSDEDLATASQATERAEKALAGGDAVVITRFGVIVILLVIIILLLA